MDEKIQNKILERRLRWYQKNEKNLIQEYGGRYVAVYNDGVRDSDIDDFELAKRIEELATRIGPIPICHVPASLEELAKRRHLNYSRFPDFASPQEEV